MKPEVLVIGANPACLLRDADGAPTAFASLWRVDWSPHGDGWALVLGAAGAEEALVLAEDVGLGGWLADVFNRHFGEHAGLPFGDPKPELATFDVSLDLRAGLRATVESARVAVEVEISEPLSRDVVEVADIALGEQTLDLFNVTFPCRHARVVVDGRALPGRPTVTGVPDEASSTAFLAVSEVWTRAR